MKQNTLKLEEYLLEVSRDIEALSQRVRDAWLESNTDPSVAAWNAIEAMKAKHEAIARDHLYEVTS